MNSENNMSMESESNSLNPSQLTNVSNLINHDQHDQKSLEKKRNEAQFEQLADQESIDYDKENNSDFNPSNRKRNNGATTSSLMPKVFIANIKSMLSSSMLNIIESVPKYTRSIVHSDTFGHFIFDKFSMPKKSSSSNDMKKLQINARNSEETSIEIDRPIKVN